RPSTRSRSSPASPGASTASRRGPRSDLLGLEHAEDVALRVLPVGEEADPGVVVLRERLGPAGRTDPLDRRVDVRHLDREDEPDHRRRLAGVGVLAHPAEDAAVDAGLLLAGPNEPVLERLDALDRPAEDLAVERRAALRIGRVDLEVDRPHG